MTDSRETRMREIESLRDELRRNLKAREQSAPVEGMDVDDPVTGYRGDPEFYRRTAAIIEKVHRRLHAVEAIVDELARLRALLTIDSDPECVMVTMPNDPEFGNVCVVRRDYFDAQIEKIARLRALLKEAGEAMEPFGKIVNVVPPFCHLNLGNGRSYDFASEEFSRAAALAAKIKGEIDGN